MQLDMKKEKIEIQKLICEKRENINVQGDMIVPDSKPDILNTINTNGIIAINKKEVLNGKIRIDGSVNTYIMYLSDGNESSIRSLNTTLEFTENFIISECTENMMADTEIKIKSIECKVLNGRKINIKIMLETRVKLFDMSEAQFITNIQSQNIQTLTNKVKINSLVGCGNTKAYAKDNIQINSEDRFAEIMKAEIKLIDTDVKISYNKVIVKSEAEFKILYLTEDNRLNTCSAKLPLVGFIEIKNLSENNICNSRLEVQNVIIKPGNIDDNSIYAEIEVRINCSVFEEKEIELLQDAYSINSKLNLEKSNLKLVNFSGKNESKCNIREKVNIPEIIDNNIISVDVNTRLLNETNANSKIRCEGEAELNFIIANKTSIGIMVKSVILPFEININNVENCENADIDTMIESQDFIIENDGNINCNIDLVAKAQMLRSTNMDVISEITEEEKDNQEDYSVIIYSIKPGDTLWKIAKKYKTTVDMIARINGIENPNKINAGDKLYIPKYVKMSRIEESKYA